MARIAVFIDHDIVIRHFILSGVLHSLEREHELVYVFPHNHKRVQTDVSSLGLKHVETIPVSAERASAYRLLYCASVLRQAHHTPKENRKAAMRFWRDALSARGFWGSWLYSWPGTYQLYRARMLRRIGQNPALEAFMEKQQPDLVLHPSVLEGLFVSDLVRWSQEHGKPSVFVMNSWDNPATKAMMVGYPDRLIVWGDQTREHAMRYMRVPEERIVCLGAAQFDVYSRPPRVEPAEYRRKLNIAADQKVLLYAGSSKGLNETRHLQMLDQAVEDGSLPNTVILYRPHPWRATAPDEQDFNEISWRHTMLVPEMAEAYQLSRAEGRINLTDYEETHVNLSAVDCVISPLSTILLEAALHGKPPAAYLPDEDIATNVFALTTSRMVHFTEFFERVDCLKCESSANLVRDCQRLLAKSQEPGIADKLRQQTEYFVSPSNEPYGERLRTVLDDVLSQVPLRA